MAALANLATLEPQDVDFALMRLRAGDRLLFQNKENRDLVWKSLSKSEKTSFCRSSVSNQLLDPRYTFEGRNIPDKGLGNDYRHHHAKLYEIAPVWKW